MSDPRARMQEAQSHLRAPNWGPERASRVLAQVHKRHRRFAVSSIALGSAALAVAVAIAIVWLAQGGSQAHAPALVDNQIELRDGTRAVGLGPASAVKLLDQSDSLVSFALESGKGWFEVTPSATRRVEVRIKDVRVVVMGTEFVVEVQGEFVHVWVQRGKVKVVSGAEFVELSTGQEGRFPAHDPPRSTNEQDVDAGPAESPSQPVLESLKEPGIEPQRRSGRDDKDTLDELSPPLAERPEPVKPESDVARLWKHADSARLRGDNATAVSALTSLLAEHPDDPRAALAAFTLGRVLMDSEGSLQTAARAFAKARKLAPEGPLVEDALLREIEAWSQAGEKSRVVSRSDKYLRLFPAGRYRRQIEEMRSLP